MKIFIQLGRTGDIINLLPLCYALHQHGQRVTLMVCRVFAELLEGCSYVDCLPFDGEMHELNRAHEEARKLTQDVRVTQVVGDAATIKRLCYAPAHQEGATKESFAKEAWGLAGYFGLWKTQPPLVFDRRNASREKALAKGPLGRPKPIILVSAKGKSSPFPYEGLLWTLLYLKFGNDFRLVDLSEIKATRFYDLLGLYEKAHCLVSVDTATLHLAYAVPTLPVVAFTNDKPNLWHGSPWRPQHIFHCRYRDFPERAPAMLASIELLKSGCRISAAEFQQIIHLWSHYDLTDKTKEAHKSAVGSWVQEYDKGGWIQTPVEVGAIGRDSANTIKDAKRYPYLKDVIRLGCLRAKNDDLICLTRHDTCFREDVLPKLKASSLGWSHRMEKRNGGMQWTPQPDLFLFSKAWWEAHVAECPNLIMAKDHYWPRVLMELIRKHGGSEIKDCIYREVGE